MTGTLAIVVALCGVAVLVAGPVRGLLQAGTSERKAMTIASDATCYRFRSLEVRVGSGSVGPDEIWRRVSDLTVGAAGAREPLATAAQRLSADLGSAGAASDVAILSSGGWTTLRDECHAP